MIAELVILNESLASCFILIKIKNLEHVQQGRDRLIEL